MSEESCITDFEQGKRQGKTEMLEWLEKELENLDFYNFLDYHGNVWQEKIKEILLSAAKIQVGDE